MLSPKIRFTPLEENWRYGMSSLVINHNVSDEDIIHALTHCVFINDHLYTPRKVNVTEKNIPTKYVDPILIDALNINIRKAPKGSNDLAERILNTLLHSKFRRGSTKLFDLYKEIFIRKIQKFIESNEQIQIVLPTLPAKGQNKARNDHTINEVSLGEMLFFAQLRDIALSIKEIYPPGIKIIIITDGIIYADMFRHNDTARTILYRNSCMELRDKMGLRNIIEIVDMDWILMGEPKFGYTKDLVHEKLLYLWKKSTIAKKHLDSLMRGMIFNMPTMNGGFSKALEIINTPFLDLSKAFQEQLKYTTLRYAANLIALSELQIISRAFPNALRATVHPKPAAQIGLHLTNEKSQVFPYHGVVLVSAKKLRETKSIRDSSTIVCLYDVYNLTMPVTKYCETGKDSSLYYLMEDE